ncbi:cathepsin B-like cysteine proteinase 4 [Rhopalosiphum padi]|uniref:cathepsin B-like cysteine proteinase 4 n=1 Tax=Rhopalosiphum padi TaxID=40932 RepID=UPI00298DDE48|nr:cathepsin B-like cysteine proteinase 4 [Rhopalosiphum padi]
MSKSILIILAAAVVAVAVRESSAVTNEATFIIDSVNADPGNTWRATDTNVIPGDGKNFEQLMGVLPRNGNAYRFAPIKTSAEGDSNEALPENFDARKRWPECSSLLSSIKDQSNCGSCWAVSAASVFSDRLCIATGGAVARNLSAEQLNTCCYRCGHGCDGGSPEAAWYFFRRHGIVTGGEYQSGEGCQPYSIYPCGKGRNTCIDSDPDTPECTIKTCTNSNYTKDYRADLHYVDTVYSLKSEEDIMADIYKYGPVQAAFYVYTDFMYYKTGVYSYTRGQIEGGHAIKILGWGVDNGTKYWLCANSWSRSWGENGLFRILRGNDECHIEDRVLAGMPHVPRRNN